MIKEFGVSTNKNDSTPSLFHSSGVLKVAVRGEPGSSVESSLNQYDDLDKLFADFSSMLNFGDSFSGYFNSNSFYKRCMLERNPYYLFRIKYAASIVVHRVIPKLAPPLRSAYMKVSKNREKFLSKPEVLGRLFKYGFKVLEFRDTDHVCFFKAQKISEPDLSKANLWPLCKLKRVGKNGELKTFYKLRTMHPYSEYMQEFIYLNNGLEGGDKFCNDFRIPSWGKFLRKYWLDEFPMIINLIKGDLKLIGPRPLTIHKYGLYSKDMQQLRIKFKPGLLPPFYADLPKTLEELMESEKKYILSFEKNGWRTDMKYFFKILKNIVVKNVRSK